MTLKGNHQTAAKVSQGPISPGLAPARVKVRAALSQVEAIEAVVLSVVCQAQYMKSHQKMSRVVSTVVTNTRESGKDTARKTSTMMVAGHMLRPPP